MAEEEAAALPAGFFLRFGGGFLIAGLALTLALYNAASAGRIIYLHCRVGGFRLAELVCRLSQNAAVADMALSHIMTDLVRMPPVMRRLAVVLFPGSPCSLCGFTPIRR